jgi:hypothetical protein
VKFFGRRIWGSGEDAAQGFKPKISESAKGKEFNMYTFSSRKPHPNNMTFYEDWSKDPEAGAALTVLSKLVAGVGFHTLVTNEKGESDVKHPHKIAVDKVAAELGFDEKLDQIAWQSLAKGFTPTELSWGYDGQLDTWSVLPSESFYIYRDRKGKVLKYTQEEARTIVTTWKGDEMADIVLFFNQETPMRPYGTALTDSIGNLLDMRKDLNADMKKGVHRWANPIPIMETSKSRANSTELAKVLTEREADDWVLVYDVTEGEVRWQPLTVEPSARFVPYVELIYNQIAEGLHAPLLLYLKNATEASAHVVMESIDRLVEGRQRHIKRRMEKYFYAPIVKNKQPIPRHIWGKPRTGLEKITMTELSMMLNSPSLAYNQKEWLLKEYGIKLPKPDWGEQAKISKIVAPPISFGAKPASDGQKPKPKEAKIPVEKLLERLNDLNTNLQIIEENFRAGKLKVHEAARFAERVIKVHMTRYHPEDIENKTSERWQQFMRKIIPSGDKSKKEYTVIVPD